MVKLRLHAPAGAEMEAAAAEIRKSFTVLEESADYPDRSGPLVRRYFTVLPPGFKVIDTATGEVQEVARTAPTTRRRRR
jgi:hypothetical protein